MSGNDDLALETLAEAIVFEHEEPPTTPSTVLGALAPERLAREKLALEKTAALAATALAGCPPVPDRLQRRLAAAGLAFCAEAGRRATPTPIAATRPVATTPAATTGPWFPTFLVGLAAGTLLWFLLMQGTKSERPAGELRAALLATDPAVVAIPWQGGPSPLRGELSGDVVWSQERQEGYLRFHGLPPLDKDHRFQLWIVDGTREGAPVDGGLFAIDDARTETVVAVKAALPIGKPKAFVVTVETNAGVVVSKQEHVVAIAGS
jgi:hypothetical protein